jgi:Tfp pilus assembly protein PilO
MIDFLKGTVTPRDWAAVAGMLGATAALAAAFYFFVHQSQQQQVARLLTENEDAKTNLQKARDINSRIEDLRKETEQIEKLVAEFEVRLPSGPELIQLVSEFEAMAQQENIFVEAQPQARSSDERKETQPYSILARGNFHQIAGFINLLERHRRYLKVSDIDMTQGERGAITARFTLSTYRFIRQDAAPRVGQ